MRDGDELRFVFADEATAAAALKKLHATSRDRRTRLGKLLKELDCLFELEGLLLEGRWVRVLIIRNKDYDREGGASTEDAMQAIVQLGNELGALDPEVVRHQELTAQLAAHTASGQRAWLVVGGGVWSARLFGAPADLRGEFMIGAKAWRGTLRGLALELEPEVPKPAWDEGAPVVLVRELPRFGILRGLRGLIDRVVSPFRG